MSCIVVNSVVGKNREKRGRESGAGVRSWESEVESREWFKSSVIFGGVGCRAKGLGFAIGVQLYAFRIKLCALVSFASLA